MVGHQGPISNSLSEVFTQTEVLKTLEEWTDYLIRNAPYFKPEEPSL